MSRFYASIQGSRGPATRCGSSSIQAHPRGWELGIMVDGYNNGGADAFAVRITGGSNGTFHPLFLAQITRVGEDHVRLEFGEALTEALGRSSVEVRVR